MMKRTALCLGVMGVTVTLAAQSKGLLTVDSIYHPERRVDFSGAPPVRSHMARCRHLCRLPAIRQRIRMAEGRRGLWPDLSAVRRRPDGDGAGVAARRDARGGAA